MQNTATTITGQITYSKGLLVFSMSKTTNPAVVVGYGTLEGFIPFLHHLGKKQVPQSTNIRAIRYLYHKYCLENMLSNNGIDMQPAMSKDNFKALTSLKLVSNSVLVYARKLFKRVAGVF